MTFRSAALGLFAISLLVACKPAARGRCSTTAECRQGAYCSVDGVCLADTQPPTVAVFVPTASDAVGGWVPRTSGTLEVQATVDDGAGSGAHSATLSFDACPATDPCTYAGTPLSTAGGITTYSFTVPRTAQAPGSEAPLTVTVKALDVAGNEGQGAGVLQIDDAPPQIGAMATVTAGVTGEDGNTWFLGGPGAPNAEIVVPVTDNGAGVESLALHLDAADLYGGFPGAQLDVTGTLASDGWHFQLPASGVRGREGRLRFTLTATDKLASIAPAQHTSTQGPDNPNTAIWVDAVPPTITAPHVDYAGASPSNACGNGVVCGRQGGTRLLPDDTTTVTFDAWDCGSGVDGAIDATASTTGGGSSSIPVVDKVRGPAQCTNGSSNRTHHYSFTFTATANAPPLDPPDTSGTTLVQLVSDAKDRVLQTTHAPSAAVSSGDGVALISLWRWKNQVAGTAAQATGAPALMPGAAGSRQIALGTNVPGGSPNVYVLNADGSPAWNATVTTVGVSGDIAAGPSGNLYAVTPPAASCSNSCSAAFHIVLPPASGGAGTVHTCPIVNNVSFGAPPAIVPSSPERAVVAATAHHFPGATNNVFVFQENNGCQQNDASSVGGGAGFTDVPGVTANWAASGTQTLFLATSSGFSTADRNSTDNGFNGAISYVNSATSVSSQAPPSIATGTVRAFFGTISSDHAVRSAFATSGSVCGGLGGACWTDDSAFPAATASNAVPVTPVFDSSYVYAADDHAIIYAFRRSSNASPNWMKDFRSSSALPSGWPTAPSSAATSAPVLLQGGSALVVRSDGVVAMVSSSGFVPMLQVAAFNSSAPVAPVLDTRGPGSVAYVPDGNGYVWALQLATAPLPAGQNAWPRPGRDSCNSRNAASSCQ